VQQSDPSHILIAGVQDLGAGQEGLAWSLNEFWPVSPKGGNYLSDSHFNTSVHAIAAL
jgi:hypothetical protein